MTALILIDIQNDFLPDGALAVRESDEILPIVNQLLEKKFDQVIATQDWHPKNHGSFAENHNQQPGDYIELNGLKQILWPTHCVQDTFGAELSSKLNLDKIDKLFYKGMDPNLDSYSAFYDNAHRKSTGLAEFLNQRNIKDLYLAGLATDYCVKYSALDAVQLGFNVHLITDACRGVNLKQHDVEKALDEMSKVGVNMMTSSSLLHKS